jgi:hypothetical protein
MTVQGHERHFGPALTTSVLPRTTDITHAHFATDLAQPHPQLPSVVFGWMHMGRVESEFSAEHDGWIFRIPDDAFSGDDRSGKVPDGRRPIPGYLTPVPNNQNDGPEQNL